MTELVVTVPAYYPAIAELLSRADWLVHAFQDPEPAGLYNPANYLYNQELNATKYCALIDLNVLQFIVNCLKKPKAHENYRTACALLVFCRISNIDIEPALAVYERINYNEENLAEAITEIELLRSLDNADVDYLAQYALEDIDSLQDIVRRPVDRESLAADLTRFKRLRHWDSIYLLTLGAISVYWNDRTPQNRKLENYIEWMLREFRLSLPCVVYAARLFGPKPMRKMMKFRPDHSEHARRTAAFNMTWDLFHIYQFFKDWTNPAKNWETLFFTDDRALKSMLRLAIEMQYSNDLGPTLRHLNRQQAATVRSLIDTRNERADRVYGTDEWSPDYRARRIEAMEGILFDDHERKGQKARVGQISDA